MKDLIVTIKFTINVKADNYDEALMEAVRTIRRATQKHFELQDGQENELSKEYFAEQDRTRLNIKVEE